jgi:hypothetical protein
MVQLQPPFVESLNGRLVLLPDGKSAALLIGRGRSTLRGRLIHRGNIVLSYAFPLLYSTDFMFPQLAIDDFRREYHGQTAIEFMLDKANSYPRADAIGVRLSDGLQADFYMKEVDIAAGLHAFAHASSLVGLPLVRVLAAVWLDRTLEPQAGLIDLVDDDHSLLRRAAKCCRCNPASLPTLDALARLDPQCGTR